MKLFKKEKHTNQSLLKKIGYRIYFGPFTGLKIPNTVFNILTTSEILGLYESCLHSKFDILLNKEIKNILLVGGNNGYYASGLSYLFRPESSIIFETEEYFHGLIKSWYYENNFNDYVLKGKATRKEFIQIQSKIDFVLMDCEGFEIELLNPEAFPWQKKADFLVEIHPFYISNLISILSKRFARTHRIELIYDDFNEDEKIDKILMGLNLNIEFNKHPNHRWIIENGQKIYTSGVFMFLTQI